MKLPLMLALPFVVVIASCGGDQYAANDAAPASEVEQTLVRMIHDWNDAVVKADTGPIERILADDFLATLPDGRIMSKRQHVEEVAMGVYKASQTSITN